MTNTFNFEDTIIVLRHGEWGFLAKDSKGYENWYKPGKGVNKTDFQPNMKYEVKIGKSGKSRYVNEFKRLDESTNPYVPKETPPPLPHEKVKEEPKKKSYEGRDFLKEAKGKTMCQFISALLSANACDALKKDQIVDLAEELVKELDRRGYF